MGDGVTMQIMVDIDGVLADFICGFTTLAAAMFGCPITTTSEQPKWDGFPGMTALQINLVWKRVKTSTDFWNRLGSLVGDKTFDRISELQVDHRVHFVTSRHGLAAHDQTVGWLEERGILSPEVLVVPSADSKGHAAAAIHADYSIDDKAGNAVYVQYHVPSVKSYILNRQYNQFDPEVLGSKVKRVNDVVDFIADIENVTMARRIELEEMNKW